MSYRPVRLKKSAKQMKLEYPCGLTKCGHCYRVFLGDMALDTAKEMYGSLEKTPNEVLRALLRMQDRIWEHGKFYRLYHRLKRKGLTKEQIEVEFKKKGWQL